MNRTYDERIKILMENCETFQREIDLLENLIRWFARIWIQSKAHYEMNTKTKMMIEAISKQSHNEESAQEALMLMTKPARGPPPMNSVIDILIKEVKTKNR